MHPNLVKIFFIVVTFGPLRPASAGEVYRPSSDCVFSMITQKKGFASGLAHNHFVTMPLAGLNIEVDSSNPLNSQFGGDVKAADLVFDDFDLIRKWQPKLSELKLFDADFSDISEKDRSEVRSHALAEDQLNEKKFSNVTYRLKNVTEGSLKGFEHFKYTALIDLTIAGKTSEVGMATNFSFVDKTLNFEGVAAATFSQFKIKPYSAFLGAVGNKDQFFFYTNCSVSPEDRQKI
jgi:hypothetical protein